jgi:hypothetical protein
MVWPRITTSISVAWSTVQGEVLARRDDQTVGDCRLERREARGSFDRHAERGDLGPRKGRGELGAGIEQRAFTGPEVSAPGEAADAHRWVQAARRHRAGEQALGGIRKEDLTLAPTEAAGPHLDAVAAAAAGQRVGVGAAAPELRGNLSP